MNEVPEEKERNCSTCRFFVFYAGCHKILECEAFGKWEVKDERDTD
jgi:hypothetical protein